MPHRLVITTTNWPVNVVTVNNGFLAWKSYATHKNNKWENVTFILKKLILYINHCTVQLTIVQYKVQDEKSRAVNLSTTHSYQETFLFETE